MLKQMSELLLLFTRSHLTLNSLVFSERVTSLEAHLEEARKRMVQLELLKQEKSKLTSQVQAQLSVIDGLKAERKLWGEELAQQGLLLRLTSCYVFECLRVPRSIRIRKDQILRYVYICSKYIEVSTFYAQVCKTKSDL